MAKFVKKIGKTSYYEINNFRAGGIIPYYIKNNSVYILINKEIRNNKLVYNSIGGKVDKYDVSIFETMRREFNEETGFLVSDKLRELFYKINMKNSIKIIKSKYLLCLLKVEDNDIWKNLPYTYNKIFNNVKQFNHRESIDLVWVNLFDFDNKNISFLLKILLFKIRQNKLFNKYNPSYYMIDSDD